MPRSGSVERPPASVATCTVSSVSAASNHFVLRSVAMRPDPANRDRGRSPSTCQSKRSWNRTFADGPSSTSRPVRIPCSESAVLEITPSVRMSRSVMPSSTPRNSSGLAATSSTPFMVKCETAPGTRLSAYAICTLSSRSALVGPPRPRTEPVSAPCHALLGSESPKISRTRSRSSGAKVSARSFTEGFAPVTTVNPPPNRDVPERTLAFVIS